MTDPMPLGRLIDERRDNFNALRLISAFAIIVSHFFPLRDGDNSHEPFQVLSGVCNIGKVVTYICFVISGMAVTRAYLRQPKAGRYLLHRLVRLLPALWVAVAFCIFAVGLPLTTMSLKTFLTTNHHETAKFAINALMYPNHYTLPGVFEHLGTNRSAVNGSLWVIAPLFLMYLMVPVLGSLQLLRKPAVVLIFVAILFAGWEAYAIHGIAPTSRWAKYDVWIEFIPHLGFFFLCGVAAASFKGKLPVNVWGSLICLVVIGATLRTRVAYTIITLAIPYLTIYLSFARWTWLNPLNAAGVIAYGVYLFGWPVQQLFMRVWTPNRSTIELILYPCIGSAVLAIMTWLLVESPTLRLINKKN